MQLNSVVFPEPFGPINPTIDPASTSMVTSSFATTPPNRLRSPLTSSIVSATKIPTREKRMRMPSMGRWCTAMIAVFAFAAMPLAVRAQDVITFGAALSLTGAVSTEGRLVKEGYDLYVKHINQRGGIRVGDRTYKVAIKYYDDESNAATSAKLYEKLITEDKITLLLGPYSSGITLAASAISERHRVPMVAAHAAATGVYDRGFKYLFATLTPVDQYSSNIIRMAAESKPRAQRIALIHENALFPKAGIDSAEAQAKAAGLEIVYKEAYPTGTKDFAPMLAALKTRNADALIVAGYTGDMIVLARQTSEQQVSLKMIGFL